MIWFNVNNDDVSNKSITSTDDQILKNIWTSENQLTEIISELIKSFNKILDEVQKWKIYFM